MAVFAVLLAVRLFRATRRSRSRHRVGPWYRGGRVRAHQLARISR